MSPAASNATMRSAQARRTGSAIQARKNAPPTPRNRSAIDHQPQRPKRGATGWSPTRLCGRRLRAWRADREDQCAADRMAVGRDYTPAQHVGAALQAGGSGNDRSRSRPRPAARSARPLGPISRSTSGETGSLKVRFIAGGGAQSPRRRQAPPSPARHARRGRRLPSTAMSARRATAQREGTATPPYYFFGSSFSAGAGSG